VKPETYLDHQAIEQPSSRANSRRDDLTWSRSSGDRAAFVTLLLAVAIWGVACAISIIRRSSSLRHLSDAKVHFHRHIVSIIRRSSSLRHARSRLIDAHRVRSRSSGDRAAFITKSHARCDAQSLASSRSSGDRAAFITRTTVREFLKFPPVSIIRRSSSLHHITGGVQDDGAVRKSRSSGDRAAFITPPLVERFQMPDLSRSSGDRAAFITPRGAQRRCAEATVSIIRRSSSLRHARAYSRARRTHTRLDHQAIEQPSSQPHSPGLMDWSESSRSSGDRAAFVTPGAPTLPRHVCESRSSGDRAAFVTVGYYSVIIPRSYITNREHLPHP
jgi:hypothetical protein